MTPAALTAHTPALCAEMLAALQEALAYVEYCTARRGTQTAAEIEKELEHVRRNVSRVGTGHWREEITFDLANARELIRRATSTHPRTE